MPGLATVVAQALLRRAVLRNMTDCGKVSNDIGDSDGKLRRTVPALETPLPTELVRHLDRTTAEPGDPIGQAVLITGVDWLVTTHLASTLYQLTLFFPSLLLL